MAYTYEQLQISDGSVSGVTDIQFDGRDVWVSTASAVNVYNYWDEASGSEYLGPESYFSRNTFPLRQVASFSVGAGVRQMQPWAGKMFILHTSTITIWDISSRALLQTLTIPETVQPVLCVAYHKIWLSNVTPDPVTDENHLVIYDLLNPGWFTTVIPGKRQSLNRDIVDGNDGHVFVTLMNEHSVAKFNGINGAFTSQYIINRHTYKMMANQDKKVYIASNATDSVTGGMLTEYDQVALTTTHFSAAGGTVTTIWEDPVQDKIWFFGQVVKMGSLVKSSKSFRWVNGVAAFGIEFTDYVGLDKTTIEHGCITPQIQYDKWNGSSFDSVTVRPYAVFVISNKVVAARLTAMVAVNSMEMLGTSMIATKSQNYYGDLT